MKVAIHQPNFLPWLGYFNKIKEADVFVILDNVQIPRGKSIVNRNTIKSAQGKTEIVLPISHPKGNKRLSTYYDVFISENKSKQKILKTIQYNYSKSPYFNEIFSEISRIFDYDSFCLLNIAFIKFLVFKLGITTDILLLSEMNINDKKNNELIIEICKKTNSSLYLSGLGAKKYNDESLFNENGILLEYQNFQHPIYSQLHGEFISHLSIIDALFNAGFEGVKKLI
ncbi:MAG: WbqC family protein [Bacteroidales bacterium]|nr:WbqC family protein [Bacteroidales bacterium]